MDFQSFLAEFGSDFKVQKGEHVFMQGERDECLYRVKSGLLKAYYVSDDGKESIKSFIGDSSLIGSLSSAYNNLNCSFNLLALKDCHLTRLPFKTLIEQARSSQVLANTMMDVLLELGIKKERREYELLCLPAEERYQIFTQQNPQLTHELTQNDIARYLGITPVALSRIKKRLQVGL